MDSVISLILSVSEVATLLCHLLSSPWIWLLLGKCALEQGRCFREGGAEIVGEKWEGLYGGQSSEVWEELGSGIYGQQSSMFWVLQRPGYVQIGLKCIRL